MSTKRARKTPKRPSNGTAAEVYLALILEADDAEVAEAVLGDAAQHSPWSRDADELRNSEPPGLYHKVMGMAACCGGLIYTVGRDGTEYDRLLRVYGNQIKRDLSHRHWLRGDERPPNIRLERFLRHFVPRLGETEADLRRVVADESERSVRRTKAKLGLDLIATDPNVALSALNAWLGDWLDTHRCLIGPKFGMTEAAHRRSMVWSFPQAFAVCWAPPDPPEGLCRMRRDRDQLSGQGATLGEFAEKWGIPSDALGYDLGRANRDRLQEAGKVMRRIATRASAEAHAVQRKIPPTPPEEDDDQQPPALNDSDVLTLRMLAEFDPHVLASAEHLREAMDPAERLSERTIRPAVARLIELGLAERPDGPKKGARATIKGRRLASRLLSKIAS